MTVQSLGISDISKYTTQLKALVLEAYKESFPLLELCDNDIMSVIGKIREFILDGSAIIFGAFDDDMQLCGFLWAYEIVFFGVKKIHETLIAVDEKHRRRGVASVLSEYLVKEAKMRNISSIECMVSTGALQSLDFHYSQGYEIHRHLLRKTF